MKPIRIALFVCLTAAAASCGATHQQDNTSGSKDTMVIRQDKTDSATNTVTTDTTRR